MLGGGDPPRARLARAGLVGCAPPPPTPLRIGLTRWIGYDTLWLADRLGFITAEGLKIEIVDLPSMGDSLRLFELGEVDVFGGTMMELLVATEHRRRPVRAVAVLDISNGLDVILARRGLEGPTALKGRRVAIEPGTTDVLLLAAALRARGLAPGDVELVHVRHRAQPAALREGRVDAVCTYFAASAAHATKRRGARLKLTSGAPRVSRSRPAAESVSSGEGGGIKGWPERRHVYDAGR